MTNIPAVGGERRERTPPPRGSLDAWGWRRRPPAFSAVVGQQRMKLALLLAAIDPKIGGVLIEGERGTAKSTLARALAAILPAQPTVVGCPYGCAPTGGDRCSACRDREAKGEELAVELRGARLVELPLGATEDRLVGSIDVEAALHQGRVVFQPGVLAEANRQVLYVDEVNLLEQHLVDSLLDAAASGVNTVEREAISVSHPSSFVLIGTMNPEEGELRPQLLDRFGLCVEVSGLGRLEDRVEVLRRDLEGGAGDVDDIELAASLVRARELLPRVRVGPELVRLAAAMSVTQGVMGHRADLVMVRAARARRALEAARLADPEGRLEVDREDLSQVAELALSHRRRSVPGAVVPAPARSAGEGAEARAEASQPGPPQAGQPTPGAPPGGPGQATEANSSGDPSDESGAPSTGEGRTTPSTAAAGDQDSVVDDSFQLTRIALPRERLRRRGSGRRSPTSSRDRRGRYVGAVEVEHPDDLALDATLRAAAPHQQSRRAEGAAPGALALHLEPWDLRQKVRQRKIGNLIVFAVDTSASMDAEQRMDVTRSALLALLKDAYVRRDRVALVSFSGRSAQVVLRPTGSVDLAERHLARIRVGGTTPLTHGLLTALQLIRAERRRDPEVLPLLVLISDGRGNISLEGEEPLLESQRVAEEVRREGIGALVIDSSRDHLPPQEQRGSPGGARFAGYHFNACVDLATRMGARYFGLFDLSEGAILRPVTEALRRLS